MSGAAPPSIAVPNHPPATGTGMAAHAGLTVAASTDDANSADDGALTPGSPQWRAYKWLCADTALPPRVAAQLLRRAVALAKRHGDGDGNDKDTNAGDAKAAFASAASVPAAVTAAASRSSEWYVDVCVSDAASWRTPWSARSVAPGAVFGRLCSTFGSDFGDDAPTAQWIVRALLCMRLVWTPPPPKAEAETGSKAAAAATVAAAAPPTAGPPQWPAVVSGERDASIFTLHTACVPRNAPVRSSSGEVQYRYASPIVCAALTRQPLVCTALLNLPAHCGLDVSVLDPIDGAAVWWACVVFPNVSLAARLLHASSDAALNAEVAAQNRTRCSLLHGAVTELLLQPNAELLLQPNAKTAEVVVLCCDAAVSRSDGSGVDLFAPFRHDPTELIANRDCLNDDERREIAAAENAAADRPLTALERVSAYIATHKSAAADPHVAAALAALTAATSRVTAYVTGVQRALADALASASSSSSHLPRPLQGIVLDYALHRRA